MTDTQRAAMGQEPVASTAKGAIMGAAYDFRDAHLSGSNDLMRSDHAALERAVDAVLQPTQKGWCTGCTPDNCQGCGGASEGYSGITKG